MEKVEIDIDGKLLSIEAGDLARQAGGAVVIRQGDTMLLVTATMAKEAREGIDFFPLTVDYREKTYAAGKIPGNFFRREARPGDIETLTCRLIDRPIRPLFPKAFKNETQVVALVISHDQTNPPDSNAITGASAALMISDIPFAVTVTDGTYNLDVTKEIAIEKFTYAELEEEDGVLVYEVEILTTAGVVRELELDARDGRVLKDEEDD